MEPVDTAELAKAGGTSAAGFTLGHYTGSDIITILTIAYLLGQCIVLAPKVWQTVKRWFNRGG